MDTQGPVAAIKWLTLPFKQAVGRLVGGLIPVDGDVGDTVGSAGVSGTSGYGDVKRTLVMPSKNLFVRHKKNPILTTRDMPVDLNRGL